MLIFLIIVSVIAYGGFTTAIAQSKSKAVFRTETGASYQEAFAAIDIPWTWMIGGLVFGPFALVAAGFYEHYPSNAIEKYLARQH